MRRFGWLAGAAMCAAITLAGCTSATGNQARGLTDNSATASTVPAAQPAPTASSASADSSALPAQSASESGSPSPSSSPSPSATASESASTCTPAAGANCDGADLSGEDLSGLDLTGISLRGADLRKANLAETVLIDARLDDAQIDGANFTKARLTADALDPRFANAMMCMTKMAAGVIDNRGCPCPSGGASGSKDTTLGTLALGGLGYTPYNYAPVNGQRISATDNSVLKHLWGTTWGGNGSTTVALPKVTGPWAGIRTGRDGTGDCLHWAVAAGAGTYPSMKLNGAMRGEIVITSVQLQQFIDDQVSNGATVDPVVGAYLGPGFTALTLPLMWNADPYITPATGSLHLYPSSFEFRGFYPFLQKADGSVARNPDQGFTYLFGSNVPLVEAPDGYTWYIATQGIFPLKAGT